jgi:uncharacterized RDD family membrane protein YckC
METAADREVVVQRVLAAAIDVLVCYVLLEIPLLYAVSVFFRPQFEALGAAALVLSVVLLLPIWSTYSFAFEWLYARTPGKVNRGLMVVTADGEPCTLGASARRNLLRYVDVVGVPPLVVGTLLPLVSGGRRLGDLLADTRVVRVEAPEADPMLTDEEQEAWEEAIEQAGDAANASEGVGKDR